MNNAFDFHGHFSYREAVQAQQSLNRIIPMVKSHIMTEYLYIHIGLRIPTDSNVFQHGTWDKRRVMNACNTLESAHLALSATIRETCRGSPLECLRYSIKIDMDEEDKIVLSLRNL